VKILSRVVSANMVDASGWEGGECGTWCSLETRCCDRRNSNWCDCETQENNHVSKVGGRKRKESAIFDSYMDNPRLNNRRGKSEPRVITW